jgi:hypothetical protein
MKYDIIKEALQFTGLIFLFSGCTILVAALIYYILLTISIVSSNIIIPFWVYIFLVWVIIVFISMYIIIKKEEENT